jgi:predicted ABC-type ATPase
MSVRRLQARFDDKWSWGRQNVPMTPEEKFFSDEAAAWAKANRTQIARAIADTVRFPGEEHPVSLFMAGSPGAGKTEAARALVTELGDFLIIDPDELRGLIPGYSGNNSWLVQDAVSRIVERILDVAFQQRQSFLLDGTLSNHGIARRNVQRCLDKKRLVQLIFVYQEPRQAWAFVQAREETEGRKIPPQRFVDQFFGAREVVQLLKHEFGTDIKIDVVLKNIDGSNRMYHANISDLNLVVPLQYSHDDVLHIVESAGGLT